MKIDPTDKQSHIYSTPKVQPSQQGPAKDDFSQVFGETVQKASAAGANKAEEAHALIAPHVQFHSPVMTSASETAHGLLNALEKYQQMLEDSTADMRRISSAVDKMRILSQSAGTQIDHMPEGHPVRMIVQETLVHMSKEIERFDMGYYIDRN